MIYKIFLQDSNCIDNDEMALIEYKGDKSVEDYVRPLIAQCLEEYQDISDARCVFNNKFYYEYIKTKPQIVRGEGMEEWDTEYRLAEINAPGYIPCVSLKSLVIKKDSDFSSVHYEVLQF